MISCKFCEISKNTFLQNASKRLFLNLVEVDFIYNFTEFNDEFITDKFHDCITLTSYKWHPEVLWRRFYREIIPDLV